MRADDRVTDALNAAVADIAAPASALVAIAGLGVKGYGPAWEIPFEVRTTPNGSHSEFLVTSCSLPGKPLLWAEQSGMHLKERVLTVGSRVLVLEKPLLNRRSSAREKHGRLFKWALVSAGTVDAAAAAEGLGIPTSGHHRATR